MSYDYALFLPRPGVDPLITATAEDEGDEGDDEAAPLPPLDPAQEALKRAIADALLRADPTLEEAPRDFEQLAKLYQKSADEVRLEIRWLELNSRAGSPGILITLNDDGAGLSVSYGHEDEQTPAVNQQVKTCLKIMQDMAGYLIYDPQSGALVNLDTDFEDA